MSPLGKGNSSNLCKAEFWQYSNAFLLLTVPKLLFARIINWYNPLKITLFLYKSTPSPNLNITIRDGSHFSCIKDCYHRSTMLMWKSTPISFSIRNKLPSLFQFKSGMQQKGNVMVICGKVLIYAQFGLAVKALMDSHLPRVSFTAIHYGCRSPCTLWY